MDWRSRKYYAATFSIEAQDMRIRHLKLIGNGVKIHFGRDTYLCIIGCNTDQCDAVEYELRKAERNDDYCMWKEIKR